MDRLDRGRRELARLTQQFVEELPAQARKLEAVWRMEVEGDRLDDTQLLVRDTLTLLHGMAHKLKGTSAGFGFTSVAEAAQAVEAQMEALLEQRAARSPEQQAAVQKALFKLKLAAFMTQKNYAARPADASDELHGLPGAAAGEEGPLVMIVDDAAMLRTRMAVGLRAAGYRVLEAENGKVAVDQARRHQPQAILMDVMMPVMDGLEAARCLRREGTLERVPIIFFTAKSRAADVYEALRCEADDYLVKPAPLAEVLARLEAVHLN